MGFSHSPNPVEIKERDSRENVRFHSRLHQRSRWSRATTTGVSHETWVKWEFYAAIGLASSMSNNPDMPG